LELTIVVLAGQRDMRFSTACQLLRASGTGEASTHNN
jgi:hypothetical protein